MEIRYPPQSEAFRQRVRAFIGQHLPSGWSGIGALDRDDAVRFTQQWRATMYENGFLGVAWPRQYGGGGLTKVEQVVLVEELARAGVPFGQPSDTFSIKMIGNTLLHWGTEAQKRYFLPRILSGEDRWCQGFSEPNAGSDLGNIATRAVLDGDHWVIDGQKIWTSIAQLASWMFLLVRTDPSLPKHRGITFLLCPMDAPGIEIRPIKMMNGESEFNEVFFTDARTAAANVVGEVNGGWAVAMTLLGYERGEEAATNPILFRYELDRLVQLARAYGRDRDPVIRDRLAWCYTKVETMRFLGYRILTRFLKDGAPGPESSTMKLYWSEYHQRATDLAMDIMGLSGLVPTGRTPARVYRADDPGAPNSTGSWAGVFLNARAGTIYAGSSEVQRNILGEVILGLPKEPRVERGSWNAPTRPAEGVALASA
jgi:alkylation response protein AidB-like acyl-CoA dehydrogenase